MEQTFVHLAHAAAWFFLVVFVLAFIGLVAIVRWVMNLFRRTEAAVEGGIEAAEHAIHR